MNRMKNGRAIGLMLVAFALLFVVGSLFAGESTVPNESTPTPTLHSVSGRVWHDLDGSGDSEPTADDNLFAGVVLNLVMSDGDIYDELGSIVVSLADGLYTIDDEGSLFDPQGNMITNTATIIADTAPDVTYTVDENGTLFGDGQPLGNVTQGGYRFLAQTITDQNGNYSFEYLPLPPDNAAYTVVIDRDSLPEVKTFNPATYELDGVPDSLHEVMLTIDSPPITGVNFSYLSGDYGDLPDFYSTTGDNAPFHALVSDGSQIMLGDSITIEPDGKPDQNALGDVDEGVASSLHFEAGKTQIAEVAVSGELPPHGAVVGVWSDWNHDGQFWEDEFLSFNVAEGVNQLAITAPDDYVMDALAIRFRLFDIDHIPGGTLDWEDFEGGAINGEVEDYVVYGGYDYDYHYEYVTPSPTAIPTAAKDFGDLPDTFSTTGEGAPSHQLVSEEEQIMLGNNITSEPDGQPHFVAVGDEDEGVAHSQQFTAGTTSTFEVKVTGVLPVEGAILGAWVDWDRSGEFTEDEFSRFNVAEGSTTIPIIAPDDYESDYLTVRFRLFAGDNLPNDTVDWTDFEGAAINGEVEDYMLFGSPSAVTLQTTSTPSPSTTGLVIVSTTLLLLIQGVYVRHRNVSGR